MGNTDLSRCIGHDNEKCCVGCSRMEIWNPIRLVDTLFYPVDGVCEFKIKYKEGELENG